MQVYKISSSKIVNLENIATYPCHVFSVVTLVLSLHKKWSFPLIISVANFNKSAGNCRFNFITKEILISLISLRKIHFLCSVSFSNLNRSLSPPPQNIIRVSKTFQCVNFVETDWFQIISTNIPFLCPLKAAKDFRFLDVFRKKRKTILEKIY